MLIRSFASVAVLALVLPTTQAIAEDLDRIDATDTLPNAKPGECYAKVIIPAKYEVTTEQLLVKPVSEKVTVAPAIFDTAEKSIIEKEAFTKINVLPAKFREEVEQVEVSPASKRKYMFLRNTKQLKKKYWLSQLKRYGRKVTVQSLRSIIQQAKSCV